MAITPINLSVTNITATSVRLGWARVIWTPLQLFLAGEKGPWYDPSDLSTLFQDAAGTIPVTADGDPVGLMLDKSGNGYHARQSVSGSRPVYRTDGTLHWLETDGVDDSMVAANQAFNLNTFTAAIAVELLGNANSRVFDSRGTGAPPVVGWQWNAFLGSSAPLIDTGSALDNLRAIILSGTKVAITQRNGVSPTILRENGVLTGSQDPPANGSILTTLDSVLFANSNGRDTQLFEGNFYGGLVVDSYIDEEAAEKIESYLAKLSGVTL